MGSNAIQIQIGANTGPVTEALKATSVQADGLSAALKTSGVSGEAAGQQISQGMQRAAGSTYEAREAARLLSEEAGVRLPRALSNVLARSESLGPILAGAFSVVAITAFIPIVEQVATKLTDFVANQFIYTKAMRDSDAATKQLTGTLLEYARNFTAAQSAIESFGKSGLELAKENSQQLTASLTDVETALTAASAKLKFWQENGASGNRDQNQAMIDDQSRTVERLIEQRRMLQEQLSLAGLQENKAQQDATKATVEQEVEANRKRIELYFELQKAIAAVGKEQTKLTETSDAQLIGGLEKQLGEQEKINDAVEAEKSAQLALQEAVAKTAVEEQQGVLAADKAAGNKEKQKADVQKLVELLEQEKAAELAIVDAKLAGQAAEMETAHESGDTAAFNEALAKYTEYQAERVTIAGAADLKIAQAQATELGKEDKQLEIYLTKFNTEFASSFQQVITRQETLGQAARKMWTGMETAALQSFAKIALAEIEGALLHKTLADQQKLSDAKTAAAGAWSATAGIPIIGPILAPIAAATAFAGVMAFEQGGVVPETQMALVHENEMVLPAHLSETFQNLAEQGTRGASGSSGDVHIHAMDAQSFQQFLKRNPAALGAGISHSVRTGHTNLTALQRGK